MKNFLLVLAFTSSSIWGATSRFEIRDLSQRNFISFISDAPLEKFIAQCHLVKGYISLDPLNLAGGISGELEVDLRTIASGSQLRDIVIQEQVIESKQYSQAMIRLKKWSQPVTGGLKEAESVTHSVEAEVEYRGRTVPLRATLKLTYFKEGDTTRKRLPGNLLKVSGQTDIDLSSLGITLADSLKPLIASKIQVSFEGVGTDKLPNDKVLLPEGPKPKEREPASRKSR
jgi:hypothetical protein